MGQRIDTVEARAKLKPRRSAYWQRLRAGLAVGFRRLSTASGGTWLVQWRDPATGVQIRRALGDFGELEPRHRFDAARKAAEALADHLGLGGRAEAMTVEEACKAYVEHLRAEGRSEAAKDAQARFRRWVFGSKLAKIDVRRLAPHHLLTWRQALIAAPVTINPHAGERERRTRERSGSSINRDMAPLRAALNHARRVGAVTTDAAWTDALAAIRGAGRRRTGYLDRTQRRALIEAAPPDLAGSCGGCRCCH